MGVGLGEGGWRGGEGQKIMWQNGYQTFDHFKKDKSDMSLWWDDDYNINCKLCVCVYISIICLKKEHIHMLKTLQCMSEFSGLWIDQNNPACTKSVRVFRVLKLDTIQKNKIFQFPCWVVFDSVKEARFLFQSVSLVRQICSWPY